MLLYITITTTLSILLLYLLYHIYKLHKLLQRYIKIPTLTYRELIRELRWFDRKSDFPIEYSELVSDELIKAIAKAVEAVLEDKEKWEA